MMDLNEKALVVAVLETIRRLFMKHHFTKNITENGTRREQKISPTVGKYTKCYV